MADAPAKWDSEKIAALLAQLHAANERFSAVRQHLERMNASSDFDHWKDRNAVEAEIRETNSEIAAISAKIHELLESQPSSGPNTPGDQPHA